MEEGWPIIKLKWEGKETDWLDCQDGNLGFGGWSYYGLGGSLLSFWRGVHNHALQYL